MDLGISRQLTFEFDGVHQPEPGGNGLGHSKAFPASTNALRDIRKFILDRGVQAALPSEVVFDLVIAASEACTNSVLYSDSSEIQVRWSMEPNRVEVTVEDGGVFRRGFLITEDGQPARGRGMAVMIALMDEVAFRPGTPGQPGTLVRLVRSTAA
jgi:anti-sigma regulatory factor (Ser/Thr protein kinase)